jgi:nucleotide-binding universal stress UspA family protein
MRTILVATDGGTESRAAVERGLDLAAGLDARIAFVHVIEPVALTDHQVPQRLPWTRDDGALGKAALLAGQRGLEHHLELVADEPIHGILGVADRVDADIIVVGSRGLGRMRRALLGSVSRGVLAHAHRPVLVVPTTSHARPAAWTRSEQEPLSLT